MVEGLGGKESMKLVSGFFDEIYKEIERMIHKD